VALILIDREGENCIAVAPGANHNLSPADVRTAAATGIFSRAAVVVLQLETPLETVEAAADLAAAAGARVILNPAPAQKLPETLLRKISVLTPNQGEAENLTGITIHDSPSIVLAANQLLERGVASVVITLGSRGAFATNATGQYWIPAYDVKAVDATAAGDVFTGALAAALAEGKALPEAARFAGAAAALATTRLGAQPSAPARAEIEEMLAKGKVREAREAPSPR
jgi:ribokinase